MMRWDCNRRCRMQDSREWFIPIPRSSISRRQEGKCSGLLRAKKNEIFKSMVGYAITPQTPCSHNLYNQRPTSPENGKELCQLVASACPLLQFADNAANDPARHRYRDNLCYP